MFLPYSAANAATSLGIVGNRRATISVASSVVYAINSTFSNLSRKGLGRMNHSVVAPIQQTFVQSSIHSPCLTRRESSGSVAFKKSFIIPFGDFLAWLERIFTS